MVCEKCGGVTIVASNIYGKSVTYHQVPSLTEGYYTHIETECA